MSSYQGENLGRGRGGEVRGRGKYYTRGRGGDIGRGQGGDRGRGRGGDGGRGRGGDGGGGGGGGRGRGSGQGSVDRGRGGSPIFQSAHAPRDVCNFFWTTGACARGFDCTFRHQQKPGS